MRRLLVFLGLCVSFLSAQDLTPPDTVNPIQIFWRHSIGGSFSVAQVTFTDWAQGGENNISYNVNTNGKSIYEDPNILWSNSYKLAFGQTKLGAQQFRKNDDRLEFESVCNFKTDMLLNPYLATTVKTQFALGYRYDSKGNRTAISKFFDPSYMTQSFGAGYQILPQVRTRLGAALREVVTSQFNSYADDPKTVEKEKIKVEDGVESVTDINWRIEENINFTSKIELFKSFKKPENIVARADNTLTTKIGRMVTLTLNMQIVNEHAVSLRTQMKQMFGVGLSYTLL